MALTAWLLNQVDLARPLPREGVRPLGPLTFPAPHGARVANVVYLRRSPDGLPSEDDFGIASIPLPKLAPGHVLVKTKWISVDPYMRTKMGGGGALLLNVTAADPKAVQLIQERIPGSENIGVVAASKAGKLSVGTLVRGYWNWTDAAVLHAESVQPLRPIHQPPTAALGAIGMPGRTAYMGLHKTLKPRPGEVLFVTGAAGAVGAAVGQLAKAAGLRVFGSAGSDAKVQHLLELGFDGAFNYRKEDPYAALARLAPHGIDLLFEITGGPVSEAVLHQLRDGGRVAVCGNIRWYNVDFDTRKTVHLAAFVHALLPSSFRAAATTLLSPWTWAQSWALKKVALRRLPQALFEARRCESEVRRAPAATRKNFTYEGLGLRCTLTKAELDAVEEQLARLVRRGQLSVREDILKGTVADVPRAFIRMMAGQNFGKQLVELAQ